MSCVFLKFYLTITYICSLGSLVAAIPGGLKAGASSGLENNGATTSFPHILAAAVKLRLLKTDSQRDPAITATDRLQYLQQRRTDTAAKRSSSETEQTRKPSCNKGKDQGTLLHQCEWW